jgi:uncharacterized integral membrane protein
MRYAKLLMGIVFLVLCIILVGQNMEALASHIVFRIDLLFFSYQSSDLPVGLIVLVAFFMGVLVLGLFDIVERFRLKSRINALMKESRAKDKELNDLRNLPITSDNVGAAKIDDNNGGS